MSLVVRNVGNNGLVTTKLKYRDRNWDNRGKLYRLFDAIWKLQSAINRRLLIK